MRDSSRSRRGKGAQFFLRTGLFDVFREGHCLEGRTNRKDEVEAHHARHRYESGARSYFQCTGGRHDEKRLAVSRLARHIIGRDAATSTRTILHDRYLAQVFVERVGEMTRHNGRRPAGRKAGNEREVAVLCGCSGAAKHQSGNEDAYFHLLSPLVALSQEHRAITTPTDPIIHSNQPPTKSGRKPASFALENRRSRPPIQIYVYIARLYFLFQHSHIPHHVDKRLQLIFADATESVFFRVVALVIAPPSRKFRIFSGGNIGFDALNLIIFR